MAQEMKLEVAQDKVGLHILAKRMEGLEQQPEGGAVLDSLRAEGIDKLGEVQGTAYAPQVTAERGKAFHSLALGHDVQVPASGQHQGGMSQKLDMPTEPARRLAHPLGYGPELAHVGGIEGEDSIGLA